MNQIVHTDSQNNSQMNDQNNNNTFGDQQIDFEQQLLNTTGSESFAEYKNSNQQYQYSDNKIPSQNFIPVAEPTMSVNQPVAVISSKSTSKRDFHHYAFLASIMTFIFSLTLTGILGYSYLTKSTVSTASNTEDVLGITAQPTISATGTPFQNSSFKITIPDGWNYTIPFDGAINITKDNYILFINGNYQRKNTDNELRIISSGLPSSDAILHSNANSLCGTFSSIKNELNTQFDYYVDSSNADSKYCNYSSDGSSRWYFSYISNGNYINNFQTDNSKGYIITMAYNSRDINKLPYKEDPALAKMLIEMSDIVKTLDLIGKI